MSTHWYVLRVKPHKERPVFDILKAKNITVFYPALKVEPVNPRSRKERPFFPGYLFVNIDLEEMGRNFLQWTEGSHGLVQFGGEPATVPENLIHEISKRLDDLQARDQIEAEGMKRGDRVRITSGVFEGYEAIFDTRLPGKERVQVLLTYLRAQPKRLQIDPSHIKKNRQ